MGKLGKNKYLDKSYEGKIIGTNKVKEVKESEYRRGGAVWRVECIGCGREIDVLPSMLINGVLPVCECGLDRCKIDIKDYKVSEVDRERIRKVRRLIIKRCYDDKSDEYRRYGAYGLKVENEWVESSEKFIRWSLENGYRPWLNLVRKDSRVGYTKENSYWGYIRGNVGLKGGGEISRKVTDDEIKELSERGIEIDKLDGSEDIEGILRVLDKGQTKKRFNNSIHIRLNRVKNDLVYLRNLVQAYNLKEEDRLDIVDDIEESLGKIVLAIDKIGG